MRAEHPDEPVDLVGQRAQLGLGDGLVLRVPPALVRGMQDPEAGACASLRLSPRPGVGIARQLADDAAAARRGPRRRGSPARARSGRWRAARPRRRAASRPSPRIRAPPVRWPRTFASGPSTARITSAIEISVGGPREQVAALLAAAAVDDPGAAQVAQDVLEEVDRDALRLRDVVGGDHVAGGGELDRRADGVVGFRGRAHGLIMLAARPRVADRRLPLRRRALRDRPSRSLKATYCHCTRCQRRTGTAASRAGARRAGLAADPPGRGARRAWQPPEDGFAKCFCSRCGGALFSRHPDGEIWSVRLGTFDADPGMRPSHRQFVAYAATWEPVPDDGVPRYRRSGSVGAQVNARMRCRPQPAEQAHEPGLRQRDAAGRRADGDVEEDRRAAARHDRVRVVLDHREVAVLRRDPPERLAAAAERGPRAAGDVPERVVRRASADPRPTSRRRRAGGSARRTPGFGAMPYTVAPSRNVPVGVAPSPSRLRAREAAAAEPRRPRAGDAPPAARRAAPRARAPRSSRRAAPAR